MLIRGIRDRRNHVRDLTQKFAEIRSWLATVTVDKVATGAFTMAVRGQRGLGVLKKSLPFSIWNRAIRSLGGS